MTDEQIEKVLQYCSNENYKCAGCPALQQCKAHSYDNTFLMSDILNYINRLKVNLESAVQSFTKMETLYKVKCTELEVAEERIRKETAKEIFNKLLYVFYTRRVVIKKFPFDSAEENRGLRSENEKGITEIKTLAKEYNVEVDE